MQITGGRYFQPGESIPDSRTGAAGAANPHSGAVPHICAPAAPPASLESARVLVMHVDERVCLPSEQ